MGQADIGLTKVVNNATPNVGGNVIFTVTATNNGPSNATGVSVSDALPTGYTLVSATPSAGTSYVAGVWTIGALNSGASATLQLSATVLASGNYTNTASRTASTPADPNAANDSASVGTTPVGQADIGLTKVVNNATPNVGGNVIFTVTATNNGPSNATGVSVSDALPTGYTLVSATPSAGTSYVAGVWTIGALNSGASATLQLSATVLASGNYTNTASRTASTPADPNAANDSASVGTTPVGQADIGLTKVVNNATPNVGGNVIFTVTATNNGPSNATGVSVSDALPTGYTLVSATPSAGTSYVAGVWTIGALNSGASATLQLSATVLASGNYTNTASRTASTPADPNAANDSAIAVVTPLATADIAMTKTVNNATPSVGQSVIFTVTVTNNGPANATGVQVTDLLPSGYSYSTHTLSQGTYSTTTGVWNVGTVNSGSAPSLNLHATVLATGSYTNTASRTASTPADPNAANDSAIAVVTPLATADIAMTKTVNNATPSVGQSVIFTVTVTNNGPANATGVQVTDLLPSGYSYSTHTLSQGTYSTTTGVWNVGTVNSGSAPSLNLHATVLATGSYTNTASRTASTPADPNAANDSATAVVTPLATADIAMTKTVNNATPSVGQSVIFTVTVTNNGPANATGMQVTDLLPSGYSYSTHTLSQGTYSTTTGVWNVGTVNSGSAPSLNLHATVLATGSYTNTASRTASTPADPNAANDSATAVVTPLATADIAMTKTVNNATPSVGQSVIFTVTVTNNGPANATGVQVTDLLPSGYSYSTHTLSQGTYSTTTGVWNVGTVNSGSAPSLNLHATVLATGSYTNTASRTASTPADPNAANDSAIVVVTPLATADIAMTKTVDNATPTVGQNVTFYVYATNNGPGNALGVQVTELLPSGYAFVSKYVYDGSYNEGTGLWNIGTINNGSNAQLRITATVLATGSYSNTATKTASSPPDPSTANDSATVVVTPVTTADVAITKTVDNATPTVGQNVTFRVYATNNGPGNALGVQVTDLLPSGYAFVSKYVYDGSYNEGTGLWNIGTINNGSNAQLRIEATVLATGSYNNTATKTASSPPDPNATNDSATVVVTPVTTADVAITKTVDNATPTVGQNVTFRVYATNNGPGNALGVQVTDLLPSGYTYVSHYDYQGSYTRSTGLWNIGTINNGSNAQLRIEATVLATGSYNNTATKTASSPPDPNATNDSATVVVTPVTTADVAITKTVNNATPTVGQNVTFYVYATNNGPGNALGVQVSDLLPSGYAFVSKYVYDGSYNEGTGLWNIGTINNGSNATLRITATVLATGSYSNTATKTASSPPDPNTANDSATVVVTPLATADIAITKTVDNATPTVGQNVTFYVYATNNGPGNALGVQVSDLLPSGYAFVSKYVYDGSYNEGTGLWNIGTINNGSNATLRITATVLATGSYSNTATKTASSPPDPNTANDSATVVVTPITTADVAITKTVNNATPTVGQNVTFYVYATNNGPGNALGVQVSDLLPSGYAFVSKYVYDGSYNEGTGLWNIGTINNGSNATLRITATVLATGSYSNTATKTASSPPDPNTANDSATVVVTPAI